MKGDTPKEVLWQAQKELTKKHEAFELERFDTACPRSADPNFLVLGSWG